MRIQRAGKFALNTYLFLQVLSAVAHAKATLLTDSSCKVMQAYGDSDEVTTKPGSLTTLKCASDSRPWQCVFSDKATQNKISNTTFNVELDESGVTVLRSVLGDTRVVIFGSVNRFVLTQTSINTAGGVGFVTKTCSGTSLRESQFKK